MRAVVETVINIAEPIFPSSQRRGGCAVNKKPRSHLVPHRRGGQFGDDPDFRRSDHYYGFALSRSRSAPVRSNKGGFGIIY